jgi:hypothetical protein
MFWVLGLGIKFFGFRVLVFGLGIKFLVFGYKHFWVLGLGIKIFGYWALGLGWVYSAGKIAHSYQILPNNI